MEPTLTTNVMNHITIILVVIIVKTIWFGENVIDVRIIPATALAVVLVKAGMKIIVIMNMRVIATTLTVITAAVVMEKVNVVMILNVKVG